MLKRILYSFGVVILIGTLAFAVISYGRGYRINTDNKSITPTGILSATSIPDSGSIFIDGKLTSATNTSLSLSPGWYQIRIGKEGYHSWEKRVRIQGEIVTKIDALLIPSNPSLRSLTTSGVVSPVLSPSGTKVAFIVSSDETTPSANLKPKTGVWVFELRTGTLGGIGVPKQIYRPNTTVDWGNSTLSWSPDEKQIILAISKSDGKKTVITSAYQLILDTPNVPPLDVTSSLTNIQADWDMVKKQKEDTLLSPLPTPINTLITRSAANIKFSPDETKILYQATASATLEPIIVPPLIGSNPTSETRKVEPGKYYIYDSKEDKNFFIADKTTFSNPDNLIWYTDSKHIVMIEKDTIYIIDYDGTNKRAVYAGPFEDSIVFPWATGGKLVILTTLNVQKTPPNLYEIDLR